MMMMMMMMTMINQCFET